MSKHASRRLDFNDLSKLVLVSSPAISPDGSRGLFVVSRINLEKDRYDRSIWMVDLDDGFYEALTSGDSDTCPKWCPDGRRFSFVSRRGLEEEEKGAGLWIGRVDAKGEPRRLAYFKGGIVDYSWSPRGDRILVISRVGEPDEDVMVIDRIPIWFNGEGFTYKTTKQLFLVDAESGVSKQVTQVEVGVTCASWSPDAKRIAYAAAVDPMRPYETRLYVYDVEAEEHREIPIGSYSIVAISWSPSGDGLALLARRLDTERGLSAHYKVWRVDPTTGEVVCLSGTLDRNAMSTVGSDARGPSCSPKLVWTSRDKIFFQVSSGGVVSLYRATSKGEVEEFLRVEGYSVDEFDASPEGDVVLFTAMSSQEPKELYSFRGGDVRKLTGFNRLLLEDYRLGRPERFKFRASDGVEIDGWILTPPGMSSGERIPWILYIHGGPKMMFGEGFMFEFHLLASKGFGVVYVNPRGSDGYSEEFADIRGHYGERDYQDLMEAVDYVLENYRFLDPERVGVAGGSYAGFMVNWIVGHTDRFKAAVTQRSICNWISKYGTTDIGFYFNVEMIGRGKTPWEDHETYWEKSPLKHVANVKTPLLIIHATEDYRCWLDQAIQMFTALKVLGVETRLVLFPKENHDLSRSGKPKHRVERLKHIVEWFEKHLKGSSGPA